jgi:hypothetical protein
MCKDGALTILRAGLMRRFRLGCLGALAAGVLTLCASGTGFCGDKAPEAFDLRAGQEATFAVTVADGKVAVGAARISKQGTAQPKEGEVTVGLGPRDAKTLREDVIAVEKTPVPIDFIATGLIGATKIDEAVVCGRLDAPASARIGAVSWRVKLHDFAVGKGGPTCE